MLSAFSSFALTKTSSDQAVQDSQYCFEKDAEVQQTKSPFVPRPIKISHQSSKDMTEVVLDALKMKSGSYGRPSASGRSPTTNAADTPNMTMLKKTKMPIVVVHQEVTEHALFHECSIECVLKDTAVMERISMWMLTMGLLMHHTDCQRSAYQESVRRVFCV
jgi:hypothetical protein